MQQQQRFDLVLKGGRVIDPAQGIDGVQDVAIADGKIAAVGRDLSGTGETVDVRGALVLPGLIDTHAHVFRHVTGRFGLDADLVGVHSAVTTLVDQGGPSLMTFPAFRSYVVEPAASRVYAFLSAYLVGGMEGHYYPELYGPHGIDVDGTVKAALANRDLVKGIKAHAEIGGFSRWGMEAFRLSKEISRQAKLPLYIHFGQLWALPEGGETRVDPDRILPDILDLLEPGDILAHPFTRHPGGFVGQDARVHPVVKEAVARGLKIDVGYGSHFSFAMAKKVLEAGILPDTLGADMHGYNTRLPSDMPADQAHMFAGSTNFSLISAMTGLLACGVPLEKLVPMVTCNAAAMLGLADEIGMLRPGAAADVSVLADERGRWVLRDNEGTQVAAERLLRPLFCLRAGRRFEADAPLLPIAQAA
ncbi:MAG: amidohydrolase/deacetylase family metallohydrolase [Alphaproteobacteria bacterium]|nr:MAG: amidohydrolase/deacetylase family metallohydrolase [Alphaproteobacteria bacterium]